MIVIVYCIFGRTRSASQTKREPFLVFWHLFLLNAMWRDAFSARLFGPRKKGTETYSVVLFCLRGKKDVYVCFFFFSASAHFFSCCCSRVGSGKKKEKGEKKKENASEPREKSKPHLIFLFCC